MARIRTIKPEITTDEKLAKVSRDARLTFILAITQADDDGLLPGNARQLMASLYPMDDGVTDRILTYWLKELVDIGVVRWRETKQGAPVLEIVKWADHQRVDHKGKSLLRPHLREWSEAGPQDSRVSREDVASVSRSDLGPRTMDHGPTTISADAERVVLPIASPAAEEVLAFYRTTHPTKRPDEKARKAIVRALRSYSADELKVAITGNALDPWAKDSGNQGLPYLLKDNAMIDKYRAKGAQFAEPLVDANGIPTERGQRILAGKA